VTRRQVGYGLVALLFTPPLIAAWREPALPVALKLLAGAIVALTAFRPGQGLYLVAGVLPLSALLAGFTQARIGGSGVAQLVVLPFLVAGFGRLIGRRDDSAGKIGRPAVLLAAVVAASGVALAVAELSYLPSPDIALQVLQHVSREYFSGSDALQDLHRAAAWIQALALAVIVERLLHTREAAPGPVVRMALTGGAAAAFFSINRVAQVAAGSSSPLETVLWALQGYRFNPFYTDLNAAGSVQALLVVPAIWLAAGVGRRWMWLLVVPLAFALWFSGSRAALAAAFVGAAVAWALMRRLPKRWWLAAGAVLLGAVAFAAWSDRPGRASIGQALAIRWDLAALGARVAATEPVVGVGAGRLRAVSAAFVPPELARKYPPAAAGDNAHNNFVQILAEFGVIGFGAFLWLLAVSVRAWRVLPGASTSAEFAGVLGGIVAFLLTCLAGHPLLDDVVRFGFCLWLGIAAGAAGTPGNQVAGRWAGRWLAVSLVVVAAMLPMRIAAERKVANLRGLIVGAGPELVGADGLRYRLAERKSSWFLATGTSLVQLPLRADAGSTNPCTVEVAVDGQPATVASISPDAWQPVQFLLPREARKSRSRRLDLLVTTEGCRLMVGELVVR
jgi:hypothetical protein